MTSRVETCRRVSLGHEGLGSKCLASSPNQSPTKLTSSGKMEEQKIYSD